MTSESQKIWFAKPPEKYGAPPARMSVSTLNEIKACPRRYALRTATYPRIWDGYGYPQKPTVKGLEGLIVHRSIEQIVKALKQSDCPSISDASFIETMRSLDGYSGVIEKQMTAISEEVTANPRLSTKAERITTKLKDCLPLLREQLQIQISKLTLSSRAKAFITFSSNSAKHYLPDGIHSEVELNDQENGWYGKINYLKLWSNGCEITDFKTGERKPEHTFQIKVYNLLWVFDKVKNPNSVPITKLALSYKNGELEVPPLTNAEIPHFTDEVKRRTIAARHEISQAIPVARPSLDNCSYCSVRQLCTTYWTDDAQKRLDEESALQHSTQNKIGLDIEVELQAPIAERIWIAKSLICGKIPSRTLLRIHFSGLNMIERLNLESGLRLRLLNVNLLELTNGERNVPTISTNWQSEVFLY